MGCVAGNKSMPKSISRSGGILGPYRILKRISKVSYELELPADLVAVHPVFHISLLKKCVGDPTSVVPLETVNVKDSLSYEDVPVEILDRQVRSLYLHFQRIAYSWNAVQSEIQFSVFSGHTTTCVGGPLFTTATPPQTQLRKSAKSQPMDRPKVHRSNHGPWSVFVDRGPLYPASDANDG
ncbi:hypothetical protein MTR67_052239 [Solanum verrucosum]|uniref:Tf2-1-like SH3-like domain-containing protein n=1 Tax=Solanum verrucosum TaxID=315347 RepID=A0AAF0V7M5_SOLVR|nr:hypothetical protein MTR67_052239 [Solanum verrucosum]